MTAIFTGMENWLVAERQQMAQPEALTSFLANKDSMLNSVGLDPESPQNWGSAKARSHIGQCAIMLDVIDRFELEGLDRDKKLGELASKSLKVASGYSMRAGYFHPRHPEELYRDRMVRLSGTNGERVSVLGMGIQDLVRAVAGRTHVSSEGIADLKSILIEGQKAASDADHNLRNLLWAERERAEGFTGSVEAQSIASEFTVAAKGLFVALCVEAVRLQHEGPDGLGPIILEPKSDANASLYLRIEDIQARVIDDITCVSSPNSIQRI